LPQPRLRLPSLLNSDGVSHVDGDSDGSGNSGNKGIAVSVVPFLVDVVFPPPPSLLPPTTTALATATVTATAQCQDAKQLYRGVGSKSRCSVLKMMLHLGGGIELASASCIRLREIGYQQIA
jgi:hypothetical protein